MNGTLVYDFTQAEDPDSGVKVVVAKTSRGLMHSFDGMPDVIDPLPLGRTLREHAFVLLAQWPDRQPYQASKSILI